MTKPGSQSEDASRWKAVVESAVDGIIVIDSEGRIEAFNPSAERLFGYASADVIGKNVKLLMPSPDHEQHDGYLARYLTSGRATIIGHGREVRGRRADGTTFPLHLSVGEVSIDGERKFTGILHDLSERVALVERLQVSEARWRSIVESAVDGIILIDGRGGIEALNPAAERLFGYREADVLGKNVSMLMPVPYREEHDGYLHRYLTSGEARIIGKGREVRGQRADGSTFPLHLSVGEVVLAGERKFTGILHDLSERVHMEERLREQAALAKLGEMAAVVAHEVKNPLAGMRAAIQMVCKRLAAESREAQVLGEVILRVDALNDLMKEMLLFARPPQPRLTAVDVGAVVHASADLLRGDPAFQAVQIDVAGGIELIPADSELLHVVFLNLMINGAQAMEGRGRIVVDLTTAERSCGIRFLDTGPGMPKDVRERAFTPFFTTKRRGTGLGLATAKRLVEAHGGDIGIECPPGGGTAVTVRLPRS
jgi:two-component system, LuxR family, sensor kinase FixL